jgi:hypothetical protein
MYALRERFVVGEAFVVSEAFVVGDGFAVREGTPGPTVYPRPGSSARWPTLVRESAAERWKGSPDDVPASPHPDPDPEDELFLLGERCARAYQQADALHYQAMKLLAEFDRRSGWRDTGFSSTAEWLAWRIGIQPNAARERLRTALALEALPLTSEAMREGGLSFTKVRALTRVATPDNEATLLALARAGSAANLERMVRGWKTLDRRSEVTAEQIRHRRRRFSAFVDDDGTVVVRGRLNPEAGALLMRAVEAASDALFREETRGKGEKEGERGPGEPQLGEEVDADLHETTPEQRRADALGLLAERALAAGFGGRGDRNGTGEEADDAPISGSRAERYQVMLHVEAGTLEEEGEAGLSELEDGTRVTAVTSRRIACDSGLVHIGHGTDGQVVGAGRRKRTVPPSVRRALEARDRGCRFPGCGLRFTDAHHVKHWADGGETSLRNLVLLCRRHHRAVHEGGVRVCLDRDGKVVFFTPRGKALAGAPPAPAKGDGRPQAGRPGVGGGRRSISMDAAPRWKRDSDIPWAIEARAWEALDSG